MNRIKISPLAFSEFSVKENSAHDAPVTAKDFGNSNQSRASNSAVFMPMHYEKNYQYPLVVWLHSDGTEGDLQKDKSGTDQPLNANGTASEIHQLMPLVSMRNFVAVAPEGNLKSRQASDPAWSQDVRCIEDAHCSVVASIEMAMNRFNINGDRIFIGGCGSGGTMAFRIAMERPNLFAGVMSINGPMPEQLSPLASWEDCRNMPVFWTQGRQSASFDQPTLCRQLKLLHVAGFALTLRQYPGQLPMSDKVLQDVNRWIMDVINAPNAPSQRRAK